MAKQTNCGDDEAQREAIAIDLIRRFEADPQTVQFIKSRHTGTQYGYAVEFWGRPFPAHYSQLQPIAKGAMSAFYSIITRHDGSLFFAGMSATQSSPSAPIPSSEPMLSLHGSLRPTPFIGGVLERGTAVHTVRLTDGRGETLEDEVVGGYVLFISERYLMNPLNIALYDVLGGICGQTQRSIN